jgi:hypothetical protein
METKRSYLPYPGTTSLSERFYYFILFSILVQLFFYVSLLVNALKTEKNIDFDVDFQSALTTPLLTTNAWLQKMFYFVVDA